MRAGAEVGVLFWMLPPAFLAEAAPCDMMAALTALETNLGASPTTGSPSHCPLRQRVRNYFQIGVFLL